MKMCPGCRLESESKFEANPDIQDTLDEEVEGAVSTSLSSSGDSSQTIVHDFDRLNQLLKKKLQEVPRKEHIKYLTLAPASWSQDKTASFFQVSMNLFILPTEICLYRM